MLPAEPLRLRALNPDAQRDTQRTLIAIRVLIAVFFLMFSFGQAIARGVLAEKFDDAQCRPACSRPASIEMSTRGV